MYNSDSDTNFICCKQLKKSSLQTLAGLVLCICLAACNRTDSPVWCNASLEVTMPSGISTATVCILLYDHSSGDLAGKLFVNEFSDAEAGRTFSIDVNMQKGTYDMVAYNFDIPDTFIRGENNISSLEAYTNEVRDYIYSSFSGSGAADSTMVYTPDRLAVARAFGAAISEGVTIHATASSVVQNSTISIPAEGLGYADSRSCAVAGMAGSLFIGTLKPGAERNLWFELEADGVLKAEFPSFGPVSDTHDLTISITTASAIWLYTTTTGSDFKAQGGISIPAPSDPGESSDDSGFKPQIGAWNDVVVEVSI